MKKRSNKLLKISLFFFFICAPLESISLGESFSLAKLTSIIVIMAWTINGFPWPRTKMLNAFYLLLGYAFLSAIWGIDQFNSFTHIFTFLIPSILVAVAMSSSIKTKNDISFYLRGYVIGCVIAAVSGLYYRDAMLNQAIIVSQERLTAFGADQNALAYLLTMGVSCVLSYYSVTVAKWTKVLSISMIGAFSLMVLSTGSRTGLALLLTVIGGYLLFQKSAKIFFSFMAVLILFIPFVLSYLPESIMDRFMETDQLVSSGDFSNRGDIWSNGLTALSENNYILGVGYSNFKTMIRLFMGESWASHNTYLTYLSEFGIVGVPIFLYVLIVLWKYAHKISQRTGNRFIYLYVIPFFLIMLTLETEYKRWIFILGILLESWYILSKRTNTIAYK